MDIYCAFCNKKINGTYTSITNGNLSTDMCHRCIRIYFKYQYLNELEY